MICEFCGDPIYLGEVFLCFQEFQLGCDPESGRAIYRPLEMEDGSKQKIAHPICLVELGASRCIIGADGSYHV